MKVNIINDSKQKLGSFEVPPWSFRSGSTGYWLGIKLIDPATKKRYQVHVQMVEIGSKKRQPNKLEPKNK